MPISTLLDAAQRGLVLFGKRGLRFPVAFAFVLCRSTVAGCASGCVDLYSQLGRIAMRGRGGALLSPRHAVVLAGMAVDIAGGPVAQELSQLPGLQQASRHSHHFDGEWVNVSLGEFAGPLGEAASREPKPLPCRRLVATRRLSCAMRKILRTGGGFGWTSSIWSCCSRIKPAS